jgi:hypothetical protein
MGQIVVDRGPTVSTVFPFAGNLVPAIGVTVGGAGGVVRLRGSSHMRNGAAVADGFQLWLVKNGVEIADTRREVRAPALTWIFLSVEHVDLAAAIGDVYALGAIANVGGASVSIETNQASLEVEARQLVTTLTVTP